MAMVATMRGETLAFTLHVTETCRDLVPSND